MPIPQGNPRMGKMKVMLAAAAGRYWIPFLIMVLYFVLSFFLTDSPCLFRLVTGLPCPACGLTRATFALFRLDFHAAFLYHPMVFLVLPIIVFVLIQDVVRKKPLKRYMPFFLAVGVCLYVVYAVRMILLFPDVEPMTYDHASILGRILEAGGFR